MVCLVIALLIPAASLFMQALERTPEENAASGRWAQRPSKENSELCEVMRQGHTVYASSHTRCTVLTRKPLRQTTRLHPSKAGPTNPVSLILSLVIPLIEKAVDQFCFLLNIFFARHLTR